MHSLTGLFNQNKNQLVDEYTSLPQALYTAQAVREMDSFAINEQGVDGFELMNKAARFSFHSLVKQWPDTHNLVILCGSGNNAGDGYIVAALAKKRGWNVEVFFASPPDKLKGDALSAYHACLNSKITPKVFDKLAFDKKCANKNTIIVDALLGTGLNSEVNGIFAEIINAANNQDCPILALDIPSGLSANTGQALGLAIKAELSATFIGLKIGLFTGSGRHYSGKIVFSDLDLKLDMFKHIEPIATRLDLHNLLKTLTPRPKDTHKGNCGHAVIIGGDLGYGGAIILAASATARMGAGLTTVITHKEHRTALLNSIPEAMVFTSHNMQDIEALLKKANVIIIGPGLGQSAWSEKMLLAALNSDTPLVIDADALNLLSKKFSSALESSNFNRKHHIFTPHPGEAARLLNSNTSEIQTDRVLSVKALQNKWEGNFLLKGSGSLICSSKGSISLCPYGNPGMASGGMGDVLSGLIGGLIAQGLKPIYALQLAVCLHAKAADILSNEYGERGLLASDLIPIARQLITINSNTPI
jgi:NAD(P)H-hydrate epimerase